MVAGKGRQRIGAAWKRIVTGNRGAAMPIMVAALIPAIGAMGSGIDYGRIYMVKSQLQAGVDAAALAGARAFSLDDGSAGSRTVQADAYFQGNFPDDYMGARNLNLGKSFAVENGINVTRIDASIDLPMTFMSLFNIAPQHITAAATAQLQPRPLEVQVVLDNTGSLKERMSDGRTRIAGLKDAATSFINVLYQGADNRAELAIGFNLYTVTTNVGAVLKKFGIDFAHQKLEALPGFTHNVDLGDPTSSTLGSEKLWPADYMGWKGCVMDDLDWSTYNDATKTLSNNLAEVDANAYDINRRLPGESGQPKIRPYFIPPTFIPKATATATVSGVENRLFKESDYYKPSGAEASNNMFFPFPNASAASDAAMATEESFIAVNTGPYANYLYENYFELNLNSNPDDDVVRYLRPEDVAKFKLGSGIDRDTFLKAYSIPANAAGTRRPEFHRFHVRDDPSTSAVESPTTGGWVIDPRRVPNGTATARLWKTATVYNILPGSGGNNTVATPHPTPNWQCPEPAMEVKYGRPKSDYLNYLKDKNAAIFSANGTMHHIGLLWGYRLLVRDDVFTRTNPTTERARRALVFMTDGQTALGVDGFQDRTRKFMDQASAPNPTTGARTYTAYGRLSDAKLATSSGSMTAQAELRFKKTCEAIKRESPEVTIYIVAVALDNSATRSMFQNCAPGRLYETANAVELKSAFDAIAVELVDLHLTR